MLEEEMMDGRADSYLHALKNRPITRLLFENLGALFNGDLFPIEPDEEQVNQSHLDLVRGFR